MPDGLVAGPAASDLLYPDADDGSKYFPGARDLRE